MCHAPEVEQMRRSDISELPEQTDEELGAGETYRIERDGQTVGFFLPVKRSNPDESQRASEKFDAMIEQMRAAGWTQADIEDAFDLTRPDPLRR
jgi:hypothetical protein